MFSEDVNPGFIHQSNEIDKTIVLSFGKCSDAKTMFTTLVYDELNCIFHSLLYSPPILNYSFKSPSLCPLTTISSAKNNHGITKLPTLTLIPSLSSYSGLNNMRSTRDREHPCLSPPTSNLSVSISPNLTLHVPSLYSSFKTCKNFTS